MCLGKGATTWGLCAVARGRYCPFGLGLLRFLYGWSMKSPHGRFKYTLCSGKFANPWTLYNPVFYGKPRRIAVFWPSVSRGEVAPCWILQGLQQFPHFNRQLLFLGEKQKEATLIFRPCNTRHYLLSCATTKNDNHNCLFFILCNYSKKKCIS